MTTARSLANTHPGFSPVAADAKKHRGSLPYFPDPPHHCWYPGHHSYGCPCKHGHRGL